MNIHKTAIISKNTEIAQDVTIGPYCIIGDNVRIGKGCKIFHHVSIYKDTEIGENNKIYPFTSLGTEPQDVKYHDEPTKLIIGDNNTIREYCDFNRSTGENTQTVIGSDCYLMAYVHVAHNCVLGNNIIIANATNLGGHVEIDSFSTIGGMVGIHQFTRIGGYTMIGSNSKISKDIVPYALYDENSNKIVINLIGLKRRGFTEDDIDIIKELFKVLFHSKMNFQQSFDKIKGSFDMNNKNVAYLVDFLGKTKRGVYLK